jgi:hypothetical protein
VKQSGYPIAIQLSKSGIPPLAELRFIALHPVDGGDERNRTADPLLAKQVLSRLSYIPTNELSIRDLSERSSIRWWAFLGSNQGPHAYQACALAS